MILSVGDKAPDFTLPDQNGDLVSLSDFEGKWLVLYSYPKDNTPGCTIEATDFTNFSKFFNKLGASIVGVSKDSAQTHCDFIDKHGLKLTLLTDESKTLLEEYGAWGEKKFMGRKIMGIIRSTFLINPEGKIEHVWYNVKVKNHVEQVLQKLETLTQ